MFALLCLSLVAGTLSAPAAPSTCLQMCPANYAPVCGSDGKTYSNQCALSSASCMRQQQGQDPLVVSYKGACGGSSLLGGQYFTTAMPVNIGYPVNGGYPEGIGGSINTGYPYSCDQMCDEDRSPVCASNGVVYDNMCRFTLAQCAAYKNGTILSVVSHTSTCHTPTAPNCEKYAVNTSDIAIEGPFGDDIKTICPHNAHAVCTERGTFSSECALCQQLERTIQLYKDMPGVTIPEYKILYDGPCQTSSSYYPGYYPGGGSIGYPGSILG